MGDNKNDQQKQLKSGTLIIKANNTGTVTSQQARNAILDKVLLSQMQSIQNIMGTSSNSTTAGGQDTKSGKDGTTKSTTKNNLDGAMFGKLAEAAKKSVKSVLLNKTNTPKEGVLSSLAGGN